MFRIANHTYDGSDGAVIKLHLFAQWILIRPIALGHELVDDHNCGRVELILSSEGTAFQQRDADGFEIIRHGGIEHDLGLLSLWRSFTIGKSNRLRTTVSAERKSAHE